MTEKFNDAVRAQLDLWDELRGIEKEFEGEFEVGDGLDDRVAEAAIGAGWDGAMSEKEVGEWLEEWMRDGARR